MQPVKEQLAFLKSEKRVREDFVPVRMKMNIPTFDEKIAWLTYFKQFEIEMMANEWTDRGTSTSYTRESAEL